MSEEAEEEEATSCVAFRDRGWFQGLRALESFGFLLRSLVEKRVGLSWPMLSHAPQGVMNMMRSSAT